MDQLPVIKNIIVPLDGSNLAEAALPVAAAIATAADAHLDLVTVALTYEAPLDSQMDTLTQEALHRAEAALRARHPRVGRTVLAGVPADQISTHATETNSDLIVMATHGRSGLRRFILGSVADRLLTLSSVPVLLVRATDNASEDLLVEETAFKRILVPLDGREATPTAIPLALAMAKLFSADVTLLYADENGETEAANRQLRAFADLFTQHGLTAEPVSRHGSPDEVIAGEAGSGDLVVMASLSATNVSRGSHRGSVADYVVKNAEAPVLVIAPKGYLGSALE